MTESIPSLPTGEQKPGIGEWVNRHPLIVVALLMLVMVVLVVPRAMTLAIYGDEIRTWRDSVQKSYSDILTWGHSTDHPPLSYLIIKASVDLFRSDGRLPMRLPSMICGIACVPMAFLLGRRIARGSPILGLLMAACAAVDLNLVWQSEQARMYSMLLLLALSAQLFMVRILQDGRARDAVVLGLLLGAGAWLHYSALALWAGVVALSIMDRSRIRITLIAVAIGALLTVPGLRKLGAMQDREAIVSTYLPNVFSQFRVLNKELSGGKVPSVIVPVCWIAGVVLLSRRDRTAAIVLGAIAATTLVNTLIAAVYRPVYGARYVTVLQPVLWLGLSTLLLECWRQALEQKHALAIRAVASLAFAGYLVIQLSRSAWPVGFSGTHEQANHFARAVAFVKEHRADQDQVQLVPEKPLAFYGKYYRLSQASEASAEHPLWIVALVPHPSEQRNDQDAKAIIPKLAREFGVSAKVVPPRDKAEMEPTRVQIYRIDATGVSVWSCTGEKLWF